MWRIAVCLEQNKTTSAKCSETERRTRAAQQGSEDRGGSRLSEDLLAHRDQTMKFQKYRDVRKGRKEGLETDDRQLGTTGRLNGRGAKGAL